MSWKSSARTVVPPRGKKKKAPPPLREPKTHEEVAQAVGRAVAIMMQRGVRECLRQKLPSTIVLMAAGESAGLVASMMGLPYPQALQATCNGVEAAYRATAPQQVTANRPIDRVLAAPASPAGDAPKPPQTGANSEKNSE